MSRCNMTFDLKINLGHSNLYFMVHCFPFLLFFALKNILVLLAKPNSGELCSPATALIILAGNEDMHKISAEFEFRPDLTTDYRVSCPWGLKNFHRLIMGKWCLHASSFIFDRIIIKVASNQDRHKSSDELDFRPLVSMAHLYVFWNEIWPWHIGLR